MRYAGLVLGMLCAGAGCGFQDVSAIKTLTVGQARSLVAKHRHEGELPLVGLSELDAQTAAALTEYEGLHLFLNGLTTLSDEAARALSQHEGDLLLGGLTTLSDEAAKTLRTNPNIGLPGNFSR